MIYTENTPNPNAVKFLSEKRLSEIGATEFQKKDIKKIKNNFIKNLLEFDGIELILISENFINSLKNGSTSGKQTRGELDFMIVKPSTAWR